MKGEAAGIFSRSRLVPGMAVAVLMLAVDTVFAARKPVRPERNSSGDIPDNHVFIPHDSPDDREPQAPAGWARRTMPHHVQFAGKYDAVAVSIVDAVAAPTLEAVKRQIVPKPQKEGRAVEI